MRRPQGDDLAERVVFIVSMVATTWVISLVLPERFGSRASGALPFLAVIGLVVGLGSTGGPGLSRLSQRALVFLVTFLNTGAVFIIVNHQMEGAVRTAAVSFL